MTAVIGILKAVFLGLAVFFSLNLVAPKRETSEQKVLFNVQAIAISGLIAIVALLPS
jgi:hypothetical protein